jgi:hypothetical protein
VVRVGTSKGSTISLWLQYIRGISSRGPTERKKKKKSMYIKIILAHEPWDDFQVHRHYMKRNCLPNKRKGYVVDTYKYTIPSHSKTIYKY